MNPDKTSSQIVKMLQAKTLTLEGRIQHRDYQAYSPSPLPGLPES
jgi:hypothetical protein